MSGYKVLFRADGNHHIGLGHLYRSLALAECISPDNSFTFAVRDLSKQVATIIAASNGEVISLPSSNNLKDEASKLASIARGYDAIVLDGYHFDTQYQEILRQGKQKLICVDDIHAYHFVADAIMNHAPGASPSSYSSEHYTKFFLGPQYALLREPFRSNRPLKEHCSLLDSVILCFGGADPHNLTEKYARAILESACTQNMKVVIGGSYQHRRSLLALCERYEQQISIFENLSATSLFQHMASSDIAIVSSSTVLFESLATGTMTIAGYYIDNQQEIYNGFLNEGVLKGVGDLNQFSGSDMVRAIREMQFSVDANKERALRLTRLFDGRIGERINQIFQELI